METKKRKVVQSDAREIIARVYHFLKNEFEFTAQHNAENCDLTHLRNIRQRTADATGSSVRTVSRILREEKELPTPSSKFPSPLKNRIKRGSKVDIDEHTAQVVRTAIQDFLATHNKMPTLKKMKSILHEKIGYNGCLDTLQQMLLKLGYQWNSQEGNSRKVLTVVPAVAKKARIHQSGAVRNGPAGEPAADPPRAGPASAAAPEAAPAHQAASSVAPACAPARAVYEVSIDLVKEEPQFL